jgi:phage virion morphogenesis protein
VTDLVFAVSDIVGHDRLGRRHAGRRRRLRDLFGRLPQARTDQLLEIVGSEIESQTRRRITDEKEAPDGTEWDEWSEGYAARRPAKGGLLDLDGHLLDSITYNADKDEVAVGSNVAYARRHQEGDEDDGIPARPYLGLSKENAVDVQRLVFDWVEKEMLG